MQKTIAPYIIILGKWINYGILEDIYNEFFVEEFLQENYYSIENRHKLNDNYWNDKFIIHDEKIPQIFRDLSKKIYLTGKYMNVIKVYDPKLGEQKNTDFFENYTFSIHNEDLRINIENSFKWANQKLIEIILEKEKFVEKITLMKRFFFIDKGDFFIHFMDLAEEELKKTAKSISQEKIQAFLDIAIKNSTSNFSTKDISCVLSKYTTFELLSAMKHFKSLRTGQSLEFEENLNFNNVYGNKKGYETFGMNINITWPLNLILSGSVVMKYQILFRYLFILKYSQRQLCNIWLAFQEQRELKKNKFIKFNF
jgi:gamma-tubulin complex component 2